MRQAAPRTTRNPLQTLGFPIPRRAGDAKRAMQPDAARTIVGRLCVSDGESGSGKQMKGLPGTAVRMRVRYAGSGRTPARVGQ
jgi:hypothetical protein